MVITVGLTGGMGCGKSTVGRMLEAKGFRRVDTDAIVREMLSTDREVIEQVVAIFGEGVAAPDGGIDRGALAQRVFTPGDALTRLEGILHPRVRAEWQGRVGREPGRWVIEIPLLFEKSLEKLFNSVVCVVCDSSQQLDRTIRRGLSEAQIKARVQRQWSPDKKVALADFVLLNNGSQSFLERQTSRLAEILTQPIPYISPPPQDE